MSKMTPPKMKLTWPERRLRRGRSPSRGHGRDTICKRGSTVQAKASRRAFHSLCIALWRRWGMQSERARRSAALTQKRGDGEGRTADVYGQCVRAFQMCPRWCSHRCSHRCSHEMRADSKTDAANKALHRRLPHSTTKLLELSDGRCGHAVRVARRKVEHAAHSPCRASFSPPLSGEAAAVCRRVRDWLAPD